MVRTCLPLRPCSQPPPHPKRRCPPPSLKDGAAPLLTERHGLDRLSPRQRQVLRLYVTEGSYKAVAHHLGLSRHTVKNLGFRAMQRLGVESITQACILVDRAERP